MVDLGRGQGVHRSRNASGGRLGARPLLAGRWFGVPGCILAIVLTWSATPASAVGWRLTGTGSPAAGESATYLLRPPSAGATVHYRLLVFTGVRACAGNGVGGDLALTTEREGYLDPGQGGHAENLSFARGQSTICLASGLPETVVARKVVRTRHGRDRVRLSAAAQANFPGDVDITATGYVGRDGDIEDQTPPSRAAQRQRRRHRALRRQGMSPGRPDERGCEHDIDADLSRTVFDHAGPQPSLRAVLKAHAVRLPDRTPPRRRHRPEPRRRANEHPDHPCHDRG